MNKKKLLVSFLALCFNAIGFSQVVADATQLSNAISAAIPGSTITLANGSWNNVFIDIDKDGSSAAPITITAETPGAVFMTGNSRVYMEGSYLTVSGLVFQNPEDLTLDGSDAIEPVIELKQCNNCKVINNKIDSYNGTEDQKELTFKWILTDGQYNEIAYNSFIGKYGIGSIINDNRNADDKDLDPSFASPDYLSIHHNYFADRTPINGVNEDNDQDAIRIGNSSTSLGESETEVYENYFHNFFGEVEMISNKSGKNKYYNNTFRNYAGSLTLRHGNDCEVYGNYFFAEGNNFTAGVRVIGERHKVYNNYIQDVNSRKDNGDGTTSGSNATGGINISNGRTDEVLNGYFQVIDSYIVNNTFVNCDYALRIGTKFDDTQSEAPENLTVANNIMFNSSTDAYQIVTASIGSSVSEGNITNLPSGDMVDDGDLYRLATGSDAIGAALGTYDFLTIDVFGGPRAANYDAGAEEFGANGNRMPYKIADVGVSIGFGATVVSKPTLGVALNTVTYSIDGGAETFNIIANVDWEITDFPSWLTLDVTSGIGNTTITATATENTTGAERTGSITIEEITGGDDLSTSLAVSQSNTFAPSEITIVAASSVGGQIDEEVSELNAYSDDTSNYWTGNPDDGEVSITFDLSCSHTLTEIGINFWKADERTTTFSIAVASNETGPFTTIIDNQTSGASGVTVETEQKFDLNNTLARYVKFIGIGNSSSTNWTSVANVNIYGDSECTTLSNEEFDNLADKGVTLFPVPVTNGELNIVSPKYGVNGIEVYNMAGKKVISTKVEGLNNAQIDVINLNSGIYFLVLEEIGVGKFIVK